MAYPATELWARQEKAKTFGWLSLLDDIVVGAVVGVSLGYLAYLRHGDISLNFPWNYLGLVMHRSRVYLRDNTIWLSYVGVKVG